MDVLVGGAGVPDGTEPEAREIDPEAVNRPERHDGLATERRKHPLIERPAGCGIRTLNRKVIEHPSILPSRELAEIVPTAGVALAKASRRIHDPPIRGGGFP